MDGKFCGMDIDDILKLATPKYVYIRDWKLGALKYILMIMIVFYVIGYDILYSCSHLVPHVASGYGSIALRHPVTECDSKHCKSNYKNIAELSYCKEAVHFTTPPPKKAKQKKTDDDTVDDSDDDTVDDSDDTVDDSGRRLKMKPGSDEVGKFITEPQECRYLDHDRLTMEEVPNEIFVPMRYVSYEQEISDDCYDPLTHPHGHATRKAAKSHFACKSTWITKKKEEFFVADIEHFQLILKHSFMAASIDLSGVSTGLSGFVESCDKTHPDTSSKCIKMMIPNTDYSPKRCAPEDVAGAKNASHYGIDSLNGSSGGEDEISIGDLFRLTPVANQYKWESDIADRKFPKNSGHPTKSLREAGGILMLAVNYENTGYGRPGFPHVDLPSIFLGAIKPITYSYRPYFIPSDNNKKVEVMFRSDKSKHRTVNIWYGMTVKLSFEGQLTVFSMTLLLTTLTTALVLVSSATTIVTMLALYVMKASEKYTLMMYQYTEDFDDYKKLMEYQANPANGKCPVSTPSGYCLARAHQCRDDLKNSEVLDILTEYAVRLNRLDGSDPEMAFPANPTEEELKAPAKREFHDRYKKFQGSFMSKALKWKKDEVIETELPRH